jgi:hypothetical protein
MAIRQSGSPVDARDETQLASARIMTTHSSITPVAQPSGSIPVAHGWSWRTLLVATFVATFLVWQLAVPVAALLGPRPQRFGWQMYSTYPDLPRAWTIDGGGVETPVDVTQHFAQLRAEVDFAAALRAGLCDASGAVAVKVADPRGTTEIVQCH